MSRLLALALAAAAVGSAGAARATEVCDRACLEGFVASYMAAMVHHRPGELKLANGARTTQNGVPFQLGSGIWQTIEGIASQPQYVADVQAQQVGYIGVIQDAGKPAFFGLQLAISNGAITEVETILTHDGEGGPAFMPPGFIYREAPYIRDVPAASRSSRETLLQVANRYWDIATTTHDGSAVPYSADCWHFENGMNTDWERAFMPGELADPPRPEQRPQADGRIWTCAREVYLTTRPWVAAHDRHFVVDTDRGLIMNLVEVDVRSPRPPAGAPPGRPRPNAPATPRPVDGPGLMPLGLSPAGMRAVMGQSYEADHFEVMRIVDGRITREQDVMHVIK